MCHAAEVFRSTSVKGQRSPVLFVFGVVQSTPHSKPGESMQAFRND